MDALRTVPAVSRRSKVSVLVLVALMSLSACKSDTGKPDAGTGNTEVEASRTALLGAVGACVLTSSREFLTQAQALEAATAAYAAKPEAGTREAAREAFRRALSAWQVVEVMQVGPAAPRAVAGGADLRDNIYSWPLVNRCAIEEQVVSRGYTAETFPTTLVNRRGLYALEYLLFYEGADTVCTTGSPAAGSNWTAIPAEEREARKRAYAAVVAADVSRRAAQLVDAWEPAKGGFLRTLETSGPGNAVYPTSQGGLNAVSDALFYVESETKDKKVARPLGLRECESTTCPELLESQYAGRSKENLRANLVGFRRIAEGCGPGYSGVGLDDLLEKVGAGALATRLREQTVAAQAAVDAIEEPDLREALAQDPASVRALYDALKSVTDVLKIDVVTVLDLELPQSVEGDND
jgi:predicted lipoprotein